MFCSGRMLLLLSSAFLFIACPSALVLTPVASDAVAQPAMPPNLATSIGSSTTPWKSVNSTDSATSVLGSNSTLNVSLTYPDGLMYTCDGQHGGYNLNLQSCLDILRLLVVVPFPFLELTWSDREVGHGIPLPQRYMSTDGTCIIEPFILPGRGTIAHASLHDLSLGASAIIDHCVRNQAEGYSGGFAKRLSADRKMGIVVVRNTPSVNCHGRLFGSIATSCQSIISTMNVSESPIVFGPRNDPSSTVILPYIRTSQDGLCAMTITNDGQKEVWSWYEAWEAAVTLSAMCAATARAGASFGLGNDRHLWMSLGIPPQGVSSS
ncbi:hypothetical protein BDR22DRAFT_865029 [Usnea florida]